MCASKAGRVVTERLVPERGLWRRHQPRGPFAQSGTPAERPSSLGNTSILYSLLTRAERLAILLVEPRASRNSSFRPPIDLPANGGYLITFHPLIFIPLNCSYYPVSSDPILLRPKRAGPLLDLGLLKPNRHEPIFSIQPRRLAKPAAISTPNHDLILLFADFARFLRACPFTKRRGPAPFSPPLLLFVRHSLAKTHECLDARILFCMDAVRTRLGEILHAKSRLPAGRASWSFRLIALGQN